MTSLSDWNYWRDLLRDALKAFRDVDKPAGLLDELVIFRAAFDTNDQPIDNLVKSRFVNNQILDELLQVLKKQNGNHEEILRLRFIDGQKRGVVAAQFFIEETTLDYRQGKALDALTGLLLDREQAVRDSRRREQLMLIPTAQYDAFVGQSEIRDELLELLNEPKAPWIGMVLGLGGLGKTALADVVTRDLIQQLSFYQVCWIRLEAEEQNGRFQSVEKSISDFLRQISGILWGDFDPAIHQSQLLLQIQKYFKQRRTLLILDNIESQPILNRLLELVSNWVNPSKVLITTRVDSSNLVPVYKQPIDALSASDARALMVSLAHLNKLTSVADLADDKFKQLYSIIGGHPLMIQLVVKLIAYQPFDQILYDLRHVQSSQMEEVFRKIFWKVWGLLRPESQQLLKVMPLVSDLGASARYLRSASGLSEERFWEAIRQLSELSLLEIWDTQELQDKRYGIHHLTRTFIKSDIYHRGNRSSHQASKDDEVEDTNSPDTENDQNNGTTGDES